MAIPISELQSLTNKSIIELYSITLVSALHGSTNVTRFHSGVGMNSNADIIWQGNTYTRFPVIAEGFEYIGRGTLPRPTLTVSNVLGTITALMLTANETTPQNDLQGAKLIRHRTMAQFLDAANFAPATTTVTSTSTVVNPSDVENITYTVTVANVGGVNIFRINGNDRPVLTMKRGSTYTFDVSDSTNASHPLRITSDAGGSQTVVVNGTQGQSGAEVIYSPAYPSAPNDVRYYCTTHGNAMGNTITMNDPLTNEVTTSSEVAVNNTNANPFGTPSSSTELPQEIYFIDKKIIENRDVVQFELVSALDLENIRAPKRQVTRKDFPSVGTFK
ncbi:phage minor tail protein L [Hyphomonas sp.]|uniref:phage minor tail protein L n=1 Tax=Hyphomonas sp. TaxID=87 RepID=UPI000C8D9E53|nr:phage minor tail protein L [Hyphomonas sp.]MAL46000.1 phage minor tail protein L [Hyphomonas sp.]|tara:strand:+ start:2439 stop:3434 length:996 start_codon:yes stop_codon:yes gene_type:complete